MRYAGWVALSLSVATRVWAAGTADVSADDYQLYMDWKDGREDERLAGDDEAQKLKKIAKSLGVAVDKLKATIAKVEPYAARLRDDSEKAIRAAVAGTSMKSQVDTVEVNTAQGHVVAGVRWRCGDPRDHDKEAATIASVVGQAAPVVKTLAVWCINEQGTKLFSAKIGRTNFTRIDKAGIERFASSRYIKLFEDVKRGPHT